MNHHHVLAFLPTGYVIVVLTAGERIQFSIWKPLPKT